MKTGQERAQAYREWARRNHPMEMWRKMYRKVRFYGMSVELAPRGFTVVMDSEPMLYIATTEEMRRAIQDIEYCGNL